MKGTTTAERARDLIERLEDPRRQGADAREAALFLRECVRELEAARPPVTLYAAARAYKRAAAAEVAAAWATERTARERKWELHGEMFRAIDRLKEATLALPDDPPTEATVSARALAESLTVQARVEGAETVLVAVQHRDEWYGCFSSSNLTATELTNQARATMQRVCEQGLRSVDSGQVETYSWAKP